MEDSSSVIIVENDWDTSGIEDILVIFDLDSTIIKTKSGKTFAENENDVKFLYDDIVINKLNSEKQIVIMSNQKGLKTLRDVETWKLKLMFMTSKLTVPYIIFGATKSDMFRKPETGMYNKFITEFNDNKTPKNITYVGDAMGRDRDFSSGDYKFALNCKMTAMSPEMYFKGIADSLDDLYRVKGFNIRDYIKETRIFPDIVKHDKELVIMVGSPCSGKSTFVRKYFSDYKIINQDTLKTKAKCLKMTELTMKEGHISIIIDNTNPTHEVRGEYTNLAKKYGYSYRFYEMCVNKELASHLNMVRYRQTGVRLPDIAINIYDSKRRKDHYIINDNITYIPFIPSELSDELLMYS